MALHAVSSLLKYAPLWVLGLLPLIQGCGGGSAAATPPAAVTPPPLPIMELPSFSPLASNTTFEREYSLTLSQAAATASLQQGLQALYQQGLTQAGADLGCKVNQRDCRARFLLKLQLPAGVYRLQGSLNFQHNVILSGDLAGTTLQLETPKDSDYALRFGVFNRGEPIDLSQSGVLSKGSRQLIIDVSAYQAGRPVAPLLAAGLTSVPDDLNGDGQVQIDELLSRYQPGAMLQLEMDTATTLPASQDLSRAWLSGQHRRWTQGELNRIVAVRSHENPMLRIIELAQPLLQTYQPQQSRVRVLDMLDQAGVQHLTLQRQVSPQTSSEQSKAVGDNLWFYHVARVQVQQLQSQSTYGAHLNLQMVYGCQISQNQFSDSLNYGSGGAGYGIDLNRHSRGCLIEDNQFERLRHGIVSHYGAAHHLIAYNQFSDSRQQSSSGELQPASDLLFHGDHAVASLVEGNVLDRLAFDDIWGANGPAHLVLRNCIRHSLQIAANSPGQFVLGNLMLGASTAWPSDPALATLHGNYLAQNRQVQWLSNYRQQLPLSAYWQQTPGYARGWQLPRFDPSQPDPCVP